MWVCDASARIHHELVQDGDLTDYTTVTTADCCQDFQTASSGRYFSKEEYYFLSIYETNV